MENQNQNKNTRIWKIGAVALLVVAFACMMVACAGKAKQDEAEGVYEDLAGLTVKTYVEP